MARSNTQQNRASTEVFEETAAAGSEALGMARRAAERSSEQFSQLFGGSSRNAEEAAQRYSRGVEVLAECGTVVGKGYQELSRAYMTWLQEQYQANLSALSKLMQCRTPQELVAAQNQLLGENLALALTANRRFSEISKEVADQTAEKITHFSDGQPKEAA